MKFLKVLIGAVLMFVVSDEAKSADYWKMWVDDPLDIRVQFALQIEGNDVVSVHAGLQEIFKDGAIGCSTTLTNLGYANLKLYHPYKVTVESGGLSYIEAALEIITGENVVNSQRPKLNGRARRNMSTKQILLAAETAKGNVQKAYRILINDVEADTFYASNPTPCGAYSNSWTVEIRRAIHPNWRIDDDSQEPNRFAGDGKWVQIAPGKSSLPERIGIAWDVSLGRLDDGNSAGRLAIREPGITENIYKPNTLYYLAKGDNVKDQIGLVITNSNGTDIRQLKAPETFVDVVPDDHEYEVRFYTPGNVGSETNSVGLYTNFLAAPFVTWLVQNPDQSFTTTNRFFLVEQRNSVSRTNSLVFDSGSKTWELRYGAGSEERVEKRQIGFNSGASITNRFETNIVQYAGGAVAKKSVEKYWEYPWGWQLKETIDDPDTNALTTTFDYHEGGAIYEETRLKKVVYPDGYWEKYNYWDWYSPYPGTLRFVYRPWKDSPTSPDSATLENCYVAEYTYNHSPVVASETEYYALGHHSTGGYSSENWVREEHFYRFAGASWDAEDMYQGLDVNEDITLPLGTSTQVFVPEAGKGYADHVFSKVEDGGPAEMYYYHWGEYSDAGNSFTPESTPGTGEDWRQSVVYGNNKYVGDQYSQAEGFWFNPINSAYISLVPHQSWKETTVVSKGKTVLKEFYVYTGPASYNEPGFELVYKLRHENDTLGHVKKITRIDVATSASRIIYEADYKGNNSVDGDLLLSEIDEDGIKTIYTYDTLKRLKTVKKVGVSSSGSYAAQADMTTTYGYDAMGRKTGEASSGGGEELGKTFAFDLAGRLASQIDTNGFTTSLGYTSGGRVITATLPGGATSVTENYLDRRVKSLTGTGVIPEYHDYWLNTNGVPRVRIFDRIIYGSASSDRWLSKGLDWIGRVVQEDRPAFNDTNTFTVRYSYPYDNLERVSTMGLNSQLIEYDSLGRESARAVSATTSSNEINIPIEPDKMDRVQGNDIYFLKVGSHWFQVTTNYTYLINSNDTQTVLSVTKERLNGFNSTTKSEVTFTDTATDVTTVTVNRASKLVTETFNPAASTLNGVRVTRNGLLQTETTPTVSTASKFWYDGLGRQTGVTNPLGFTASTEYSDDEGWIIGETDFAGNQATFEYYDNPGSDGFNTGQVKAMVDAHGKKTIFEYNGRGDVVEISGDVPYPEEREYNNFGELWKLKTFRTGVTPDVTTWNYHEPSGLLSSKVDASSESVSFTYETNNLLRTKVWARGITITNVYNEFGDLSGLSYSDGGATPWVTLTDYSRLGQPRQITDGTGTRTLEYDHYGRQLKETGTSGDYSGIAVTNRYHATYGRDLLTVSGLSSTLQHVYTYDTYGRLGSVGYGTTSANYSYFAGTDLIETVTGKLNTATVLTTTRQWEFGSRLRSIENVVSSKVISGHHYGYDALNRRTEATLEDGSTWFYDYNDRGEVVSAKRAWSDGSPTPGQQFEYDYDNIGNRTESKSGGDAEGQGLRTATYTANAVNEYSAISWPTSMDIVGAAYRGAEVLVNSASVSYRSGEYFQKEINAGNGSGPGNPGVTVEASQGSTTTDTGNALIAPASESLVYDDDGNLTQDGLWDYTWDAENRLVEMVSRTSVSTSARRKLVFIYDYMGRRASKKEFAWAVTDYSGTPVTNVKFIYDGWALVAEVEPTGDNLIRSYVWGVDLSGVVSKAGGVGGLAVIADHGGGGNYFSGYDGNGNVMALVKTDATIGARYEYSPFGETIRESGVFAKDNPMRFSTKVCDVSAGLVFYGWRYYSPKLGRWISRDPVAESGGVNLYTGLLNNPTNLIDPDGRMAGSVGDTTAGVSLGGWIASITLGATTTAFMEATSQMMGASPGDEIDWGKIAKAAAVGGLTGAVGYPIGKAYLSGKSILELTFNGVGKNAGKKIMASGMAGSMTGTFTGLLREGADRIFGGVQNTGARIFADAMFEGMLDELASPEG